MAVSDLRLLFLDVCRKAHSPGAGPQPDCRSGVQLPLQSGPDAGIKLLLSDPSAHPVHPELGLYPLFPGNAVPFPDFPGTDALRLHVSFGPAARPDGPASEGPSYPAYPGDRPDEQGHSAAEMAVDHIIPGLCIRGRFARTRCFPPPWAAGGPATPSPAF